MNAQIGYLVGLAMEYIQKGDLDGAERLLKQALKIAPRNSEIFRLLGVNYAFKKNIPLALEMLDRSIKIEPKNWLSYSNRGNILRDLKRSDEALACYEKAIALQPGYAEVHNNKGNLLQDLKRNDEALACYEKAIVLQPNYGEAYSNLGNALQNLDLPEMALAAYEKGIEVSGGMGAINLGSYIHCKMKLCNWQEITHLIQRIIDGNFNHLVATTPFHLLPFLDDPQLIKSFAQKYMSLEHPNQTQLGAIGKSLPSDKIRLGYFSPDFRNHPVSFLMAGVIEAHHRSRFEVIAFSMGVDKPDDMRNRLKLSFDKFIDISKKSDIEVAKLARELEVDIAIDLGGMTQDSRPGIFAYRAAPIQIGYIGYLGTMAAEYMDYIIADKIIVPRELQDAYSEKIIYLPSYQANDSVRKISDRVFSREELGLPEKGFVYCCFNNNFKFTPSVFDSWANILRSVEGSVLLLYADSEEVKKNLRIELEGRGVDGSRLVFGGRLPREEYLARYRVADLFLDTSPYNAGTTASDALWSGLPIVTFLGKSFPARMCASLLTAMQLPELIARSQSEYEEIAIDLGRNPDRIKLIKNKLSTNRLSSPLFNTEVFTRNLESAYESAYARFRDGFPPEHIEL